MFIYKWLIFLIESGMLSRVTLDEKNTSGSGYKPTFKVQQIITLFLVYNTFRARISRDQAR